MTPCALSEPTVSFGLREFFGNGPDHDRAFIAALEDARDRVAIVDVTQCPGGSVYLGDYATGAAMKTAGVIPGSDLTCEAALAKLFYLFQLGLSLEQVKTIMPLEIRGELTGPAFVPPLDNPLVRSVVGRDVDAASRSS